MINGFIASLQHLTETSAVVYDSILPVEAIADYLLKIKSLFLS
jgi:hypothetical protein